MGFWHTGYMDFHEPVDLAAWPTATPKAPEYRCPDCELVFSTERDRRAHRFDGHAMKRPTLVFRGRDCGRSRLLVAAPSVPGDWKLTDVSAIAINGAAASPEAVIERLSTTKSGVHTVTARSGAVEREFEFEFCLAEQADLQLVDQALGKLIENRELSRGAVDAFISRAGRGPTARRYREGIASYLYGVLKREASHDGGGEERDLAGSAYEDRYNRAVSILREFDRPPAEAICGLVALHYNHFEIAGRKTNSPRVADVSLRFASIIAGVRFHSESLADRVHDSYDEALSDSAAEELLHVGAMALDGSELGPLERALSNLSDARPADQLKVHLVAAEALLAAGDVRAALKHAEALRHTKITDEWYAGFRDRAGQVGH